MTNDPALLDDYRALAQNYPPLPAVADRHAAHAISGHCADSRQPRDADDCRYRAR
jgi:hypothetical protein